MRFSKFNSEGYYDPTAYEAFQHIEAERRAAMRPSSAACEYRPLVFICSPFSGDRSGNERKARDYSRFAVQKGMIPIAPHLLFPQFLNEDNPSDRELGLFFGIVLLTKCQQLWVFGNHISRGMAREIRKAQAKGIPIRFFTEDCEEVDQDG